MSPAMMRATARSGPDSGIAVIRPAAMLSLESPTTSKSGRLPPSIQLLVAASLLIIVPSLKPSQCQQLTRTTNLNAANYHQIKPMSRQVASTIPLRLESTQANNHQRQQQQQQHHVMPSNQRRRNDLQQELSNYELQQLLQEQSNVVTQQQPKAARQLFITDFVSNQSHKLLKNFVNNTLADLVARQPISGGTTLTRFISANHRPASFVGDQAASSTNGLAMDELALAKAEQPQRSLLPAIGKLYSFLFPNQVQQEQQSKVRDSLTMGEELIEPSSSDAMDFYDPPGSVFGARAAKSSSAGKFISLSAPYETDQARGSLLHQQATVASPVTFVDLASNESKWHRDKSNETPVAYPDEQQQNSDPGGLIEESPAMIQEHSRPEIIQSSQQADEEDQMSMADSEGGVIGNSEGVEFRPYVDDANSNLMDYEPAHELNRNSSQVDKQQHNQSDLLNHHQMEHGNESTSEPSTADSFFNQLPSSYDAPMRVPPEGYYDDYYKLASSQTSTGYQAPLMESLIPEYQQQQQRPMADNLDQADFMAMIGNDTGSAPTIRANSSSSGNPNLESHQLNQFYLNHQQQASRQNEDDPASEQRVEKFTAGSNRTLAGYESNPSNASMPSQGFSNQQAENATRASMSNEHDNIQVILANTNSSFDPINNERVINYISEGKNITFQPSLGKSPRHTFVNKDMNELPAAAPENDASQQQQPQNNSYPERVPVSLEVSGSHVTLTSTTTPSSYLVDDDEQHSRGKFYLPSKEFDAATNDDRQRATPESKVARNKNDADVNSARNDYEPHPQGSSDDFADDAGETLRRLSLESGQTNYGQYNRNNQPPGHSASKNKPRKPDVDGHKRRDRGQQPHTGGGSNRRRRQQQTRRRPHQVTEAHFNPSDLIMSRPTPQPSMTESALETITDLPSKVKKLRENQPDKNELMNELLTALDRVKVAIYKLQPLTAKMNAIYRKSVTSNTRDTLLDNNKGTYAKRYPPGDYDDNYDRMHPSELLLTRTNPTANSRNGRRAPRTGPSRHPRRMMTMTGTGTNDELAEESATSATYLPAPSHMFANNTNSQVLAITGNSESDDDREEEQQQASDDEIVATGIGRRMGDGRMKGEVISFGLGADDEDLRQKLANQFAETPTNSSSSATGVAVAAAARVAYLDSSPTFGYRITIYRPSEDGESEEEQLQVIGGDEASASDRLSYSINGDEQQDLMVTSESSLVESVSEERPKTSGSSGSTREGEEGELLRGDESQKSEKEKKKKGEKWEKKKEKKEKDAKKEEKSQRSQEKKKMADEESKKKKEYKKIKQNKGLISKESKKMHRDKHIKAHDRGAAKEKALKERTQIEFFEREQIVDDEFEKGKKSTMKAGWQSGQEAKKSSKDIAAGDSMSMGGSHFVAHQQPAHFSEKGHGSSVESTSGKKSNKFEKKDMESKGKKFKGWREKGYKIITETEFIDRGSLHDSAYKKRDKGAAHHQKYKKQEASSEGHHGSMQEHHKKSHKKEEKKEKMQEKHMKKGEGEEKKGEKKKKNMMEKKGKNGEKDEEADEEESMLAATVSPSDEIIEMMNKNQRSRQPISVRDSRVWRFAPGNGLPQQSSALSRLLNAEHDSNPTSQPINPLTSDVRHRPNTTVGRDQYQYQYQQQQSARKESVISSSSNHLSGDEGSLRRSDGGTGPTQQRPNSSASALFDIVDNFNGQRMNKTRVGTYEVDASQTARPTILADSRNPLQPTRSEAQLSNAKFLAPESRAQSSASGMQQPPITNHTSTTTRKPKLEPFAGGDGASRSELQKLVSLLRAQQAARRQPERPGANRLVTDQSFNSLNTRQLASAIAQDISYPPPTTNNQPSLVAAQAYLHQLAQKANSNLNNPSEMLDFTANTFSSPPNEPLLQTSFLSHQNLPMSASNYQQASYFAPPPVGFEFEPSAGQQAGSVLFQGDHLLDYDGDTILAPSSHSSFVSD